MFASRVLLFTCIVLTIVSICYGQVRVPEELIEHQFKLPRPLVQSASEITAMLQVYCGVMGLYMCERVSVLSQKQETSRTLVIDSVRAHLRGAKHVSGTLDLSTLADRPIGTYTEEWDPNLFTEEDPLSFFDAMYMYVSPSEAIGLDQPYTRDTNHAVHMMGTDKHVLAVPLNKFIPRKLATEIVYFSNTNLTVTSLIRKSAGISPWQLATYLRRVEPEVTKAIYFYLTATSVYDFSIPVVKERPESCMDGVQSGTETDTDCGGANLCERCGYMGRCTLYSDCQSMQCVNQRCTLPRQLRRTER